MKNVVLIIATTLVLVVIVQFGTVIITVTEKLDAASAIGVWPMVVRYNCVLFAMNVT